MKDDKAWERTRGKDKMRHVPDAFSQESKGLAT